MTDDQYKEVADRATELLGGVYPDRFEEVFDQMAAEVVARMKSEARYTDLDIERELGMEVGGAIIDKLEASLKPRHMRKLETEGIDIKHPETKAALQKLVQVGGIDQSDYDKLVGLEMEIVPRFPGLRAGEIQNALQWREAGEL